jgi:hypothetical protein
MPGGRSIRHGISGGARRSLSVNIRLLVCVSGSPRRPPGRGEEMSNIVEGLIWLFIALALLYLRDVLDKIDKKVL